MLLLHLNDAIDITPSASQEGMVKLEWASAKLVWWASNNVTRLFDASGEMMWPIWFKNGRHLPQDVWTELSMDLLKHDIICVAIAPPQMVFDLPDMDMM